MAITEKIHQRVQRLPASFQAEVLDFVEYLLAKAKREEAEEWLDFSLASAMRGLEDEAAPMYTTADLKVVFV